MRYKPQYPLAMIVSAVLLALIIAGCVISPRRTFTGTPAATPTPTDTPIPTATPTPTPTAGSTTVSAMGTQFLFVGGASGINGFKINQDGSLLPMPASVLPANAKVRAMASMGGALIVANENSVSAFAVNKETGVIAQTDSMQADAVESLAANSSANVVTAVTQKGTVALRIAGGKLEPAVGAMEVSASESSSVPRSTQAVLDSTGKFMYVLSATEATTDAYRVDHGKPEPLTPSAYPIPRGAAALAIVNP